MDRKWIGEKDQLTVMQWNGLANNLCTPTSFPHADPSVLEWKNRFSKILREINTRAPDIMCLQEVDEFKQINSELTMQGYRGVFFKKQGTDSLDGCAIFVQSRVVTHECKWFKLGGTQIAVGMHVEVSDVQFVVVCTHLKAKPEYESVRLEQCKKLVQWVEEWRPLPVIICGDFNDVMGSEPIEYMMRSGFVSAYDVHHPTPFDTTCKQRATKVCRAIDYIWTSPAVEVYGILELPSEHMPLYMSFQINQWLVLCDAYGKYFHHECKQWKSHELLNVDTTQITRLITQWMPISERLSWSVVVERELKLAEWNLLNEFMSSLLNRMDPPRRKKQIRLLNHQKYVRGLLPENSRKM